MNHNFNNKMHKTVGVVNVANFAARGEQLNLATQFSASSDDTLSNVTWTLPEVLKPPNAHYCAKITVDSCIFTNSFHNVTPANNQLKILTQWTENGTPKEHIINVEIPVGHYDAYTLMDYLNTDGVCNDSIDGYTYGLGDYGDIDHPPFKLQSSDLTKFEVLPPTKGTLGILGAVSASHQFTGVGLILDEETRGLLYLLGMISSKSNTKFLADSGRIVWLFRIIPKDGFYEYLTFTQPLDKDVLEYPLGAPYQMRLGSVKSFSIIMSGVSAHTRMSYSDLQHSQSIATIPVESDYGQLCIYRPALQNGTLTPQLDLQEIRIRMVSNETGQNVDFAGSDWSLNLYVEFLEMIQHDHGDEAARGLLKSDAPAFTNRFEHRVEPRESDPIKRALKRKRG